MHRKDTGLRDAMEILDDAITKARQVSEIRLTTIHSHQPNIFCIIREVLTAKALVSIQSSLESKGLYVPMY